MASGLPFDPYGLIAATNRAPLGEWLNVCYGERCVTVQVLDRCGACDIDLSFGAFGMLAPHSAGVIWATVEVLE